MTTSDKLLDYMQSYGLPEWTVAYYDKRKPKWCLHHNWISGCRMESSADHRFPHLCLVCGDPSHGVMWEDEHTYWKCPIMVEYRNEYNLLLKHLDQNYPARRTSRNRNFEPFLDELTAHMRSIAQKPTRAASHNQTTTAWQNQVGKQHARSRGGTPATGTHTWVCMYVCVCVCVCVCCASCVSMKLGSDAVHMIVYVCVYCLRPNISHLWVLLLRPQLPRKLLQRRGLKQSRLPPQVRSRPTTTTTTAEPPRACMFCK